jgi:hypothetical protein
MIWQSGGKGIIGIPAEVNEVDKEGLLEYFPDEETIALWADGQDAPWPPLPDLRFEVGQRVECRVGPHPVRGWAAGVVVATFYKEPDWPPGMLAPYQIQLDDGRLIFAPQDIDEVIREEQAST